MKTRRWVWLIGVLAGGMVVLFLRTYVDRGALILIFGAVVSLAMIAGELGIVCIQVRSPSQADLVPPGARPADGRVELLPIAGAEGEANAADPRFLAFRGLKPLEVREHSPAASRQLTRSNPPLLGRIALVSLFIGRDSRSWQDDEIARSHQSIIRAGEWVEREASRWRAPVNLLVSQVYFVVENHAVDDVELTFVPEGDEVGPIEEGAMTKALIDASRAALSLGFRDVVDWMNQITERVDVDAVVWLVHPRRAGRSLAIPLDLSELSGVSLALCYARESSFPEPLTRPPWTDPVTIAHELFHLFGASDKYGTSLRSYPARSVTSHDIMRMEFANLGRLRVDSLTAVEIGWYSPNKSLTADFSG